jgi:hypothetical protein
VILDSITTIKTTATKSYSRSKTGNVYCIGTRILSGFAEIMGLDIHALLTGFLSLDVRCGQLFEVRNGTEIFRSDCGTVNLAKNIP